ncbi:hypothetical protein HMPREF9371_2505 [Neisseria shayeganii 871]|uniref:Uncharacterized protein n=2 Tax=Neisseria shayeganii TaxID=607712 RepID=G4CLL4_9NEIS|nr:hypothetical protein HMPREF9371_2505 [Neisseria shayeganii 871]
MEKNYDGLLIHYPDEIIILDPSISFKIIFYASEDGRFLGLFHWSLVEKNLWDGVIDGELADRQEFLRIIRSENLIDW